jgi:hypothetical protein
MEAFEELFFGANVGADAKNSNRNVISVGPEL